jgi:hypothetical protein
MGIGYLVDRRRRRSGKHAVTGQTIELGFCHRHTTFNGLPSDAQPTLK